MSSLSDLKQMIEIIEEEVGNIDSIFLSADHEIIFLGIDEIDIKADSEAGKKLDDLGAFFSSEYDCWAIFV